MKLSFVARNRVFRTAGILLVALLLLLSLAVFAACGNDAVTSGPYAKVSDDFKLNYYVGELFTEQGTLNLFEDGVLSAEVPITEDMVTGFDTSTAGTVILKVTSGDYVASVAITVHPVKALSISIDEDTIPNAIYKNSLFPTTVTMTVELSDGTTEQGVAVSANMLGGFSSAIVGSQKVSVTYLGATTSFVLAVKEDVRVSIELVGAREEYYVNDPLNLQGAQINVKWESGRSGTVTPAGSDVSSFSTALGGSHIAKVTYKGLVCDYRYTVIKRPSSFELTANTLPDIFEKGDAFPTTGKGVLTYDDGSKEPINSISAENIPDFSTAAAGDHQVDVVVSGVKDTYSYTVLPSITSAVAYGFTGAVRQNTDFNGLGELIVIYENAADGSEQRENIPLWTAEATRSKVTDDDSGAVIQRIATDRLRLDYCTSEVGESVVQCVHFRTRTIEFSVLVYPENESETAVGSISVAGAFAPIRLGDPIDVSGVQIGINYKYLSPDIVACQASWVSFEMPDAIEGDSKDVPVTISYYGATAETTLRILSAEYAARATSIVVYNMPALYFEGEELSLTGARMYVTFGGGYSTETVVIQPSYVSGFDTTVAGDKTMTVTYEECIYEVPYRVIAEADKTQVTDLAIDGFTPRLFVGDTIDDIDRSAYTLTVIYGYGFGREEISLADEAVTLSGADAFEEGLQAVTVKCGEFEKTFSVTVYPEADKTRVTSIAVIPNTMTADIGTQPDLSQVALTVTYGYGYRTMQILLGSSGVSVDLSTLKPDEAGLSRVAVSYAGCGCGMFVNFVSGESTAVLKRIEIRQGAKTEFIVGEALSGVELVLYYNNETGILPVTPDMAPEFSTEGAADHSVTIFYGGRGVVYSYTVIEAPQTEEQEG